MTANATIPGLARLDDIKAWAWTVRDIRKHGGFANTSRGSLQIAKDVPFLAVYVPPRREGERAFSEAMAAFNDDDVRVLARPFELAPDLASTAMEALSTS